MKSIRQLYTLGIWTVKSGNEKKFIAEWEAFAAWTAKNQPGAGKGYLLRDQDHPEQFISFGPWESVDAINAWRDRVEFKSFGTKVRVLCSHFEPHSMEQVGSSEG